MSYNSVIKVVRAVSRLLENEEQKAKLLRKAIEEGEKSGYLEDFDFDSHLKYIHEKYL